MEPEERIAPQHVTGDAAVAAYDQQLARALELLQQDGVPFAIGVLDEDGDMNFIAALALPADECVRFLQGVQNACGRMLDFYENQGEEVT